ncbi:MAG: hypothetical protein ACE5JM_18245, partial [Armatimonadota bacterium]
LVYSNDMVWLGWAQDQLRVTASQRSEWIDTINSFQCPEGGYYANPPFEWLTWPHATWRSLMSLNMLGGRPRFSLPVLEPLQDVETCRQWVAGHGSGPAPLPHHRYALGAFVASMAEDPEWLPTFLDAIRALQNPNTGLWPTAEGVDSLSPTFLFATLLIKLGGHVPRRKLLIDSVLTLQRDTGMFTTAGPGFHDMDAAFLLEHLSRETGHRRDDCLTALRRMHVALGAMWRERREEVFDHNPHRTLAIHGICSVLGAALPEVDSQHPWRFVYHATQFAHVPSTADTGGPRSG